MQILEVSGAVRQL